MRKGLKMALRVLGERKQAARTLGVSYFTVGEWVRGRYQPKAEMKNKILAKVNEIEGVHFTADELDYLGD